MDKRRMQGLAMGAGSGILYGSVNVIAKIIDADPFVAAAVMYLAAAVVLSPFLRGLQIAPGDRLRFLVMGLVGGGVAPILLFFGLTRTAASDAALLLTIEMVATAVFAAVFLRERFAGREGFGLALLLSAAALVATAATGSGRTTPLGALLVLSAAVLWGSRTP